MGAFTYAIIPLLSDKIKCSWYFLWKSIVKWCKIMTKTELCYHPFGQNVKTSKKLKIMLDFCSAVCYNNRALWAKGLKRKPHKKKFLRNFEKPIDIGLHSWYTKIPPRKDKRLGSGGAVLENWTTEEKVQSTRKSRNTWTEIVNTISYNSFK